MQRPLQWYQSLDLFIDVGLTRTQGVVGIDILVLLPSSVHFASLRYCELEAARTNLTRPRTRDHVPQPQLDNSVGFI